MRLGHLDEPPKGLWVRGTVLPQEAAVAVVGSRHPTLSGIDVAHELARGLAEVGIQVVSGMARGIDAAAHRGALAGGGTTVAVLGAGLDFPYPSAHGQLRQEIAAAGSLISENGVMTPPAPRRFPWRNRLIAALSRAVIVVEAGERSGALSTATWATNLGREVLAVPGSIRTPQCAGSNQLIRDGARPFLGLDDIFEVAPDLQPASGSVAVRATKGRDQDRSRRNHRWADGPSLQILEILGSEPIHPDSLAEALDLPAAALASRLTVLELAGAIALLPSGLVVRMP